MQVISSAEVAAPPEVVWELLCDPHRFPELVEVTDRMVEVPDEPMSEGYTYREYGGLGPFKSESEWTVTEFEPKHRQVHEGDDGSMAFHLVIELEPTDTGCRIRHVLRIEGRGAMGLLSKVTWPLFMRRMADRAMDQTLQNFKRAAEASA